MAWKEALALPLRAMEEYKPVGSAPDAGSHLPEVLQGVLRRVDGLFVGCRPWQVAAYSVGGFVVLRCVARTLMQEEPLVERVKRVVFWVAKFVPSIRRQVEDSLVDARTGFEASLLKPIEGHTPITEMPTDGVPIEALEGMMTVLAETGGPKERMLEGRVNGTIYVGGADYEQYTAMLTRTYGMFAWTNPLHPSIFPGVRQMESEVVSMTLNLFHASARPTSCGLVTSGGTESILLALLSHRNLFREKYGITEPNIVVPDTAHPAFEKGCLYFGIHIRKVKVKSNFQADVPAMRRRMDRNTIMLAGTFPAYPHGNFDPIEELAALALSRRVGMHVDCCLGSFMVAFMERAGYPMPKFDFLLPGVTTISCDTHKYGFAPKGSSVVMFAEAELRRAAVVICPNWPGGVYGTATLAGSRPGALVAATWASLMYHGLEGYTQKCRAVIETTRKLAAAIADTPGIRLMCEPDSSVVSFTSDVFDIYRLVETLLHQRGWDASALQFPPGIHMGVTMAHTTPGVIENFVRDLRECVAECVATPDEKATGAGAIYGTSQAVPDRSIIEEVVKIFFETSYKVEK